MIFKNNKPSSFYESYVKDIQATISANAAAEFACIWRESVRLGGAKSRTAISDELSTKLNALQDELAGSDLFDDEPSKRGVMRRAIPKTLVEKVGLEELLKRLPEAYQRALFSAWVAAHFVSCASLSAMVSGLMLGLADLQVWCERVKRRFLPLRSRFVSLSSR